MMESNQAGGDTARSPGRFQVSPDVVGQRVSDLMVLVHMETNRIYELNRTASRFWELLSEGNDVAGIQQRLLQEFDVTDAQLAGEINELLAAFHTEYLIVPGKES